MKITDKILKEIFPDLLVYEGCVMEPRIDGKVLARVHEDDYLITRAGEIYKLQANGVLKEMTQTMSTSGYLQVSIHGKRVLVHKLIAIYFCDFPFTLTFVLDNTIEVNHKNGVKTDNWADNLEWCTHSQNMLHAYDTGLIRGRGTRASA